MIIDETKSDTGCIKIIWSNFIFEQNTNDSNARKILLYAISLHSVKKIGRPRNKGISEQSESKPSEDILSPAIISEITEKEKTRRERIGQKNRETWNRRRKDTQPTRRDIERWRRKEAQKKYRTSIQPIDELKVEESDVDKDTESFDEEDDKQSDDSIDDESVI